MFANRSRGWLLAVVAGLSVAGGSLLPPAAWACGGEKVQVTVVAILATDQNTVVDPEVRCIAEHIQKLRPRLTGFRLATTTCKSLAVGKKEKFPLVEDQVAWVTVEHGADPDKRYGLAVKLPLGVGEITYTICCEKYFPLWTRYQTKNKECLLIAVMVNPCPKKK
jgi:hypothetical protein